MRARTSSLGGLVLVMACNQVFGLDPTVALDASPPSDASLDRDDDGVLNESDLCPDVADPAQHDEDGDGVGDACDPCPLDARTFGDADGDGIDNACDPHRDQPDCLILFDSFLTFDAAQWIVASGTVAAHGVDALAIGRATGPGGFVPKDLAGVFAIRARFEAASLGASSYVVAT